MTPYPGKPRPLWLLVVALVALVALVGCGGPADQGPAAPAPTSEGPLFAFAATTLDGQAFDGMSLAGKPTVLWFWAPWCPVCLQQAPGVREAVAQYADRVNIVGVAGLDKTEAMPEFVRLAKVESMTHIADEAGDVWKRFEVTAQSTFVLIDASGAILFKGRLKSSEVPDRVAGMIG
jgi:thiol-disulfide isomerase/thioredoxin